MSRCTLRNIFTVLIYAGVAIFLYPYVTGHFSHALYLPRRRHRPRCPLRHPALRLHRRRLPRSRPRRSGQQRRALTPKLKLTCFKNF